MIKSCRDRDTERLLAGHRVRRFEAIERQARRKLLLLDAATVLEDLRREAVREICAVASAWHSETIWPIVKRAWWAHVS